MPRTVRGLTGGARSYRALSHSQCAIAPGSHPVQICHVPCAVSLPLRDHKRFTSRADLPRTARSPTAGARSHLAHIKCSRATYHAQSHCRCAIATGSHQVHTCHVPCAVSWPVGDRHCLTASAYVPRTVRSLTHSLPVRDLNWLFSRADLPRTLRSLTASARSQLALLKCVSHQVQACHVPCAVSLPMRDRNWLTSRAEPWS